jgi:hypothetical protein
METQTFKKFCPVCKLGNESGAQVCQYCGADLTGKSSGVPTTQRVDESFELSEELKAEVVKEHTPPAKGISLFLLNRGEPIALCLEEEFVLGRAGEMSNEPMVDLTGFEAYAMGVSRRHAMIRASGEKYVLIDLNSSNGTWLNGQRLVPTKPYDLPSGAVIQLGRMNLVVSYMRPSVNRQNK